MHKFYTDENVLGSGIVMEIHCHITEICEPSMSSPLFSVIFFMSFQSIVIPVRYHNKFPKFVCNVIDLCTTLGQIIKIVWILPFI